MEKRKTKTSTAVKRRWNDEHYTTFRFVLDKDTAAAYKALCADLKQPLAEIPKQAVLEFINRNQ